MVQTELSEWNQVFTYVVRALKHMVPEFKGVAAGMQHHLAQIRYFLEAHPHGKENIEHLEALHPLWRENILVVDDCEAVAELLVTFLSKEGHVDTAENGAVGLEKIRNTYYQLIISDVDMPVINGLDFFQQAADAFPGIEERFVFFTGDPSPRSLAFFNKNQLKFLTKPATIQQIRSFYLQSLRKLSMTA